MVKSSLKNILKIFLFTFIIFSIFNTLSCEAADISPIEDPFENANKWQPKIEDDKTFTEKAGQVLEIINVMGMITAVLVAAGLGIKYMLGSVEEKATYKKDYIPYLVGVFMLAVATTLPNIIYKLTTSALDMHIG